jgi:DNA-binding transcriptional MerR regulator
MTGLNIKAVAERTGVPLHTLRAWERRYGIPRPDRNAENRYRLYDDQDIADVLWMKRQVEAGVSPAQASAMLRQGARLNVAQPVAAPTMATANALFDAFVALDEVQAQRVLNEAWSAFAPEQVIVNVIQPVMRRIGDNWERNLLSVEQEHFASNLIRQRLHAMIQAQATPALTAPRLVAACAPEEQHDLGLLMLTLLAKRQGWNVTYLGQRTPLDELRSASAHAQYVVLSVSTVTGLASLLPLWTEKFSSAPILFGGEMFNAVPSLREHVPGAYLGDDAIAAVQNLATRAPQVSQWQPEVVRLNAALELQMLRLELASDAVTRFMGRPQIQADAFYETRGNMSHSALYLTDILACALAFDAPEMMETQGAWLNSLLGSRHVPTPALHQFLNAYRAAVKRAVSKESNKRAQALLTRFAATVDEQAGVNAQ